MVGTLNQTIPPGGARLLAEIQYSTQDGHRNQHNIDLSQHPNCRTPQVIDVTRVSIKYSTSLIPRVLALTIHMCEEMVSGEAPSTKH